MPSFPNLTTDEIRRRLEREAQSPRKRPPPYPLELFSEPPTPAAVLIPFFRWKNAWHLLLIRRSAPPEDPHGGQVAFPGGRRDPQDESAQFNALREAQEEVGISPHDVQILGALQPALTISNYKVTPVIGEIPWPYSILPASAEVARAFSIPLLWLADPKHHHIKQRALPRPFPSIDVVYFQPYQGEVLWGASARITLNLLEVLALID